MFQQSNPVRTKVHAVAGLNPRAGFSLIELMAVMVILAILMTFLAFRLGSLGETAKYATTEQFLHQVGGAASAYEQETGDYPPSKWQSEWGPTPNKSNLGVEVLCATLWGDSGGGFGISEDRLLNFDADEAKKNLTSHANNDLFELADDWGNPIAYFHRQDYGRLDSYLTVDERGIEGESVVKALKNPVTGNYYNPRSFQLISAGEDGVFGGEESDDIYNFKWTEGGSN
jgi:prepilin-type N-terminal cleavage/methylation domain-containing protein